MIAEASTDRQTANYTFTDADRAKSLKVPKTNPIADLVEAQQVLMKIIKGSVRYQTDDGDIIDVPAREIAQCASALVKLEAQKRACQGKPNPATFKVEVKRRASTRTEQLAPLPAEPIQIQPG